MPAVSINTIDWPLCPYDDENFDSVSIGQSSVVDSDYAANRIRLHETQREFSSSDQRLIPIGQVNLQIELVNTLNISTSETQPLQEAVATNTRKRKIGRKMKIFYGILAVLILTDVIAAVFSMLSDSWENKMTTPGPDTKTTMPLETTISNVYVISLRFC